MSTVESVASSRLSTTRINGSFVKDSVTMARRNLLRLRRTPQVIVFSTVQPVLFVFLFRYVFGGSITPPGISYVDFLIPGVMLQTALFAGGNTAIGLAQDLEKGSVDRFKSLPMSRAAVLTGRTMADSLRAVLTFIIIFFVGLAVGFRPEGSPLAIVAGIALAVLFAHAFNWVFALLAIYVKDPESVQAASFVPTFPLVFAASTFAPVENMPEWLQAFASRQPVTVTVDTIRALMNDGDVAASLWQSLAWISIILIVSVTLATRKFASA